MSTRTQWLLALSNSILVAVIVYGLFVHLGIGMIRTRTVLVLPRLSRLCSMVYRYVIDLYNYYAYKKSI